MEPPPWIDPGNAFRIVVKVEKYKAFAESGIVQIDEQEHVLCEADWKVRKNEHFKSMIKHRWNVGVENVSVEVVDRWNEGYQNVNSCAGSVGISGVTNEDTQQDGEAYVLTDEDMVYEAMGFKATDEAAAQAAAQAAAEEEEGSIPDIPPDVQEEMHEDGINVDDNEPSEPILEWDRDNPDMRVGTIYPNMVDFKLAVRQHAIVNEFELRTEKSNKERFRGHCLAKWCPWVQINNAIHKCASRSRVVGKMANQAWVAERAIPLLKRKLGMGVADVKEALEDKYKIKMNYQTVWFKAEVELRQPGSVVEIDTVKIGEKHHFNGFFCAFRDSIDGFLYGCKPYISIDSTALNGQWNGHMPAALALDGHNWMFPLAFGFFDSETKENRIWFMEQLGKAIGVLPRMAICTNACKGLESAMKHVFPWAEQRECFRHLMENMKKKFTGNVYAENMWPVATTYSVAKHNYFMSKVLEASPEVGKWLDEHHNLLWARSKFSSDIKCDYILNNLAESWNAWIK
ncbi:uncharacterized protein LOC101765173 [Setaria italica]|uniref:uncharacterized protein LOC101765173 n=1 Tax=Setaria italica TaxID=4555 RepID=UPI00064579DB|nr:uncharacterized protein LOC101765173 [Setaria italica]